MMEHDRRKYFLTSHDDKRVIEVSEQLWNASRFRSEMTSYELCCYVQPSEECYCKVWLQDSKVVSFKSFDELVEFIIRDLYLNIACAKDLAQKMTALPPNTKINLGVY